MSLADARRLAADLSRRYQSGEHDLRAVLESERREATQRREAEQRKIEAAAARQRVTLGALLTAYVDQLHHDNKESARKVGGTMHRHVRDAWPKLWATPIERVTDDDLLSVVSRLVEQGKLRTAEKLRSYLRSAYTAAMRARRDARALPALRALKVTSNPARDLVPIEGAIKARERTLSIAEIRAYWSHIASMPGPKGGLMRFHLLTGCQRIEQIRRITMDDIDHDPLSVHMEDPKGRRKQPRAHEVPLIPAAIEAIEAMGPRIDNYLWTVTAGELGASYSTLRDLTHSVAAAMAKAGQLEGNVFNPGDLRRTVETRLAALGVSQHVRAQLQSHGLGGVQTRHYDRHDYLPEKRAALETLYHLLTGDGTAVMPIKRKAR